MPRSGTSLVEQIIASHPSARGAGELQFWLDTGRREPALSCGKESSTSRSGKAGGGLPACSRGPGPDASRVVDKATFNCDYLGLLHSVFPNARIIYMRRDPIDTCLSCYFQKFSGPELHHGSVRPRGLLSGAPAIDGALASRRCLRERYSRCLTKSSSPTRSPGRIKILDFLELEWDDRCLAFDKTERPVNTASAWQVRQKIYSRSVQRWRHYEKFIGPLKGLQTPRNFRGP